MPSALPFEFAGFLLGLLLGSFLNVCIARLPEHESIVHPRSYCPACKRTIRWFDNLPILSWLLLRARCRDCKLPIPWRYPAVELATGLWFAYLGYLAFEATHLDSSIVPSTIATPTPDQLAFYLIHLLALALLGFLVLGFIVMDWRTQRLPDAFTFSGIFAALFLVCTQAIFLGPTEAQINLTNHHFRISSPGSFIERGNVFLTGPEHLIFGRLLATSAIALILLLIRWSYRALRHREGMGLGDVKMMAMIAAFLGFAPAILTLFLGTLLATLYALPMVLRGRANALTRLPFGSFLGIAGLITAVVGDRVIDWYTGLFG